MLCCVRQDMWVYKKQPSAVSSGCLSGILRTKGDQTFFLLAAPFMATIRTEIAAGVIPSMREA